MTTGTLFDLGSSFPAVTFLMPDSFLGDDSLTYHESLSIVETVQEFGSLALMVLATALGHLFYHPPVLLCVLSNPLLLPPPHIANDVRTASSTHYHTCTEVWGSDAE